MTAIRAVVFDIGGVLEITPDLGVTRRWEARLGLAAGEADERLRDVWARGSVGTMSEPEVHGAIRDRLGLDERQLTAFLADLWHEYLGTPNTPLIEYARRLRPRYRTAILSNSFVGAREREQAAYGFEDLVDEVVYSHEAGMAKPDPRIYALVCARLGVTAGEAVFLDDTGPCVAGARAAGLHALLFSGTAQAIRDIGALLAAGPLAGDQRPPAPGTYPPGTTRRAGGMGPPLAAAPEVTGDDRRHDARAAPAPHRQVRGDLHAGQPDRAGRLPGRGEQEADPRGGPAGRTGPPGAGDRVDGDRPG